MQELRPRKEAGDAPLGAGARYRLKLDRYPERTGESAFVRLLKSVLRALGLKRRMGRAAG